MVDSIERAALPSDDNKLAFHTPKYRTLSPKSDMTLEEVILLLQYMQISVAVELYVTLPERLQRHFREE